MAELYIVVGSAFVIIVLLMFGMWAGAGARPGSLYIPILGVALLFGLPFSLSVAQLGGFPVALTSLPHKDYASPTFYSGLHSGDVRQASWQHGTIFFSYVAGQRGYSGMLLPANVSMERLRRKFGVKNGHSPYSLYSLGSATSCGAFHVKNGALAPASSAPVSPTKKFIVPSGCVNRIVILTPHGVLLDAVSPDERGGRGVAD